MELEKHSPKWLLSEIKNSKSDAHALFKIIEFQKALTEQCNIADVVGQSEQLKAFREWWNKDNEGVCTTITHKDIERYLKSL